MPFEKGHKLAKGRQRGSMNRATADVREAIAKLAENLAPEVEGWLSSVASEDPGRAIDLYLRAIEYHVPKLARTESTLADATDDKLWAEMERRLKAKAITIVPELPESTQP